MSLTIWHVCVFSFVSFVDLMAMSNMEKDQVVYDATQFVGNSGAHLL